MGVGRLVFVALVACLGAFGQTCTFTFTPASVSVAATTNPLFQGSFNVTASNSSCRRTPVSNVDWLVIQLGQTGTGNGLVGYAVENNLTPVARVGTISANNDAKVGQLIADAMEKVGRDGVITVEDGKTLTTEVTVVEGMQFDRGFLSPHFVNNAQTMEASFEKPLILVYEDKISSVNKLLPLLEKVKQANKALIIIAEDVEGEALATLVMNRLRGSLDVVAIKAPGFGDRRREMLDDIAVLTGGQVISEEAGDRLEAATLKHLGRAARVRVSRDHTTLSGGAGKAEARKARTAEISKLLESTVSKYDQEKLRERLARLNGGIAEIEVGGQTELELKDRKGRMEDAVAATRAAMEEGVVAGGGVALLRSLGVLDALKSKSDGERAGIEI